MALASDRPHIFAEYCIIAVLIRKTGEETFLTTRTALERTECDSQLGSMFISQQEHDLVGSFPASQNVFRPLEFLQ